MSKQEGRGDLQSLATDMPATDGQVLDFIEERGCVPVTALAAATGTSHVNAYRRLRRLEDRGLVDRKRSDADSRTKGHPPDLWFTTDVEPERPTLDDLRRAKQILEEEGRSPSLEEFR